MRNFEVLICNTHDYIFALRVSVVAIVVRRLNCVLAFEGVVCHPVCLLHCETSVGINGAPIINDSKAIPVSHTLNWSIRLSPRANKWLSWLRWIEAVQQHGTKSTHHRVEMLNEIFGFRLISSLLRLIGKRFMLVIWHMQTFRMLLRTQSMKLLPSPTTH